MQIIIMTVGTSLLTNPDRNLPDADKRPWVNQKSIGDRTSAVNWMNQKVTADLSCLEYFSAETNTFYHLDLTSNDRLILLHSDTPTGLECAEVLQDFFQVSLNQKDIQLLKLPGINYDSEESSSALEKMAEQLKDLINQSQSMVTLAATGGFKAQTMIMALVGNNSKVPVCYLHEEFKGLVYLPYILPSGETERRFSVANLKDSEVDRRKVINVQEGKSHHRPKSWNKIKKILSEIPWINYVRYDEDAYSAPKNGIRKSPRENHILLVHLFESKEVRMAISIDTTALTIEEQQQAALELRERIGSLL